MTKLVGKLKERLAIRQNQLQFAGYVFGEITKDDLLQSGIPENHVEIISLRFGLESTEKMTLAQIALRFNISTERVRQIEFKVIRRYLSFRIEEYSKEEYKAAIQQFSDMISKNLVKEIKELEKALTE